MTWKVDATTSSPLDSRAVVESASLGQWDLLSPKDGRKLRPVVVIERVELYVPAVRRKKKMPDGRMVDEPLNKLKMSFVGKKKFLIVNTTNRKTLQQLFGPKMQGWIGQKIELYIDDEVRMGRQKTGGLRISNRRPDGQPTEEPLENAVDEAAQAVINEAKAEFEDDGDDGRGPPAGGLQRGPEL